MLLTFYGIRSERLLLEQLDDNLLFRWFVGLTPDDSIWQPTTFTKNRDRLLNCLLYTSPSPRDVEESRMPSSA